MKVSVAEHSSCMTFDRSGYIMLWTHTQNTHAHTYVYIDIHKSKLARNIQHRKKSCWDFMNLFIYNRIYTFWPTQTRTETAHSPTFTVCGCCNAALVVFNQISRCGYKVMGIFWVFTPCSNVNCCVPVCQNAEDMTRWQSMVFFLCACYICVVQLDTCPDLFLRWVLPE
jgi:hypothetical protein